MYSSKGWSKETLEGAVSRMIEPLQHRGPDDRGSWVDASRGVAFGFRRLSVIDLSAHGHQPMQSSSGRLTLIFNGEVYNHRELRRELERGGAHFRGHSDTEVVLAAFEHWGVEKALEHFVGMFALALWDDTDRRLHLVRDRFGIKPLYVYLRPGLAMFASELKALVAGPEFDNSLDRDGLTSYLRYLYVPAPHTIYRHVTKLMPGHILTIDHPDAAVPDPTPYWSLSRVMQRGRSCPFDGSDAEGVEQGERLLMDAVKLRMRADVPVGAFLSGGIDSSLVVALMQSCSNLRVKTFSVAFVEEQYNEAPHAARVAQHLGTDHTEVALTAEDALAIVPRLPHMFDEPFASPSSMPNFLLSELARRDVTVALSGTGGDEVFAGYNRYVYGARLFPRILALPQSLRRHIATAIQNVDTTTWDRLHQKMVRWCPLAAKHRLVGGKLHKLAKLVTLESPASMYRSLISAWQEPEAVVVGGKDYGAVLDRVPTTDGAADDLLRFLMLADQHSYLPDDQLTMVDRVSMAVSLEARVPILDHRVVEFAWRLPAALKVRHGEGKWLLRQILHRWVPKALVDRPKAGLSVPIDRWLRGPLREWAEDLLAPDILAKDGILEPEAIVRTWRRFQSGEGHDAPGLWAVLMFQAWRAEWQR
jgi:asparagine synthase (glutamine-hydrolysing)